MYGTLSHSHILLVLLSLANGADWKAEDALNLMHFLSLDGSSHPAAVAACDTDWGGY